MAETRKLLSNILWRVETSAASSAITENILVCLTSAMFCRIFRCFPEVSFDAENSNSRSGLKLTLSMIRSSSTLVNETMTLYTVPISISEQSSFRQAGSLESTDALTRHSSPLVHWITAANKRLSLVHNYAQPTKERLSGMVFWFFFLNNSD